MGSILLTRRDEGQTMAEYAVVLAVITPALILAFATMADGIVARLQTVVALRRSTQTKGPVTRALFHAPEKTRRAAAAKPPLRTHDPSPSRGLMEYLGGENPGRSW